MHLPGLWDSAHYVAHTSRGELMLALDMAIEYWKLLLEDRWDYLDLWIEFLRERYNKTIPKDTWNLLYDFVQDIGTDFSQYDENGILSKGEGIDDRGLASDY